MYNFVVLCSEKAAGMAASTHVGVLVCMLICLRVFICICECKCIYIMYYVPKSYQAHGLTVEVIVGT